VPTDEICRLPEEGHLEINRLGDELARAGDELRFRCSGRHPLPTSSF
jgi:hypothetical protein